MKGKFKSEIQTKPKIRTIKVDYLARVEGEGAFYVKIKGDKVQNAKLIIFEPPRFFEAFLRGRRYDEAPDITARICGICPVAYQMSSIHAFESAFDVEIHPQIRALRRLFYFGEWIESHVLHIFLLHAPDFLGYQDAIQMAKEHPDLVKMALNLKKLGNEILTVIGGREIHPVSACAGGFTHVPAKSELDQFIEKLQWGIEAAVKTVRWVAQLPFPELEKDYEFVALRHPDEYPLCEGRLVSNKGLDISIREYESHFEEEHIKHSTSLHSKLIGRGLYFVGPLARFNLNFDKLAPLARKEAQAVGFTPVNGNSFKSIIARAVEVLHACEESLDIIQRYEKPPEPKVAIRPYGATAYGCTEAPRGILYHRYAVDDNGVIRGAKIVPPTSQNQKVIESDLVDFMEKNIPMPDDQLTWHCEQLIRNYDPCISCSCHFINLKIERN